MSDVAIRVEGLGKRFRLQHRGGGPRYRTLREDLLSAPRELWTRLRRRRTEQEEFWALKDVSFEVKQGEVLGIIGRNGAGKSTLLKILSRIMDPTAGEATVYGRIGSLLEVGTGFHPELTGRENIYLSGALLGMKRDEVRRRFDEIVEFAGVEKFLDTPCKHYSSGMYTRLGFAVAAHLDTEILLVDEVLAVGDAEFQRRTVGKVKSIAQCGRTVLLVSHQLAMIQSICGGVIYLSDGKIRSHSDACAVIKRYLCDLRSVPTGQINRARSNGSGGARFERIVASSVDDSPIIVSGGGARFCITITADKAYGAVLMGLGIDGDNGERIATLFSRFTGVDFSLSPDSTLEVTCDVPSLPLIPGRYWLALHLAQEGEIIEHIEQALSFEVSAGDYFGTGQLPTRDQGVIILRQHWYTN